MPHVKQDLSKISVEVPFTDADIKPLEQQEDDGVDGVESADEMEEENAAGEGELEGNEDAEGEEEAGEVMSGAIECAELVECVTGKSFETRKMNRQKRKVDDSSTASGKKLKYMKTASGTFLVSSPTGTASTGTEAGLYWFLSVKAQLRYAQFEGPSSI